MSASRPQSSLWLWLAAAVLSAGWIVACTALFPLVPAWFTPVTFWVAVLALAPAARGLRDSVPPPVAAVLTLLSLLLAVVGSWIVVNGMPVSDLPVAVALSRVFLSLWTPLVQLRLDLQSPRLPSAGMLVVVVALALAAGLVLVSTASLLGHLLDALGPPVVRGLGRHAERLGTATFVQAGYYARRIFTVSLVLLIVFGAPLAYVNARMIPEVGSPAGAVPIAPAFVRQLVQDARSGTIYIAGAGIGILASRDGGTSWQPASLGIAESTVWSLAADQRDGTLYAGTNAGAVYRSRDGGPSWQPVIATFDNTPVWTIAVDQRDGTLYAGTNAGAIYRSRDGGASWQVVAARLVGVAVWTILVDDADGTVYAGTSGDGVYRSRDGGASWQAINNGLPAPALPVGALLIHPVSRELFVGGDDGVYQSSDGGDTWRPYGEGLPVGANSPPLERNIRTFALDLQTNTLYAGANNGAFYRRSLGAAAWTRMADGLPESNIGSMFYDNARRTLLVGTEGEGLHRSSDDSRSWSPLWPRIDAIATWEFAWRLQNNTIYAGTDRGLLRSRDAGLTWLPAGPVTLDIRSLAINQRSGAIYVGTSDGAVVRSDDGGLNWTILKDKLETIVYGLAVDQRDGTVYAGVIEQGRGTVLRLRQRDSGWEESILPVATASIWFLETDPQSGALYAGTGGDGLFRSTDGGETWQRLTGGLSKEAGSTGALLIHPSPDLLLLGGADGVYRSDDNGRTWRPFSDGLQKRRIQAFLRDPTGAIYTGTEDGGVFRLPPGESTWQSVSRSLSNRHIWDLTLIPGDGALLAGTNGAGIFRFDASEESWLSLTNLWGSERITALTYGLGEARYAATSDSILRASSPGDLWQIVSRSRDTMQALTYDTQQRALFYIIDDRLFFKPDAPNQSQTLAVNSASILDWLGLGGSYALGARQPGDLQPAWAVYGDGLRQLQLGERSARPQGAIHQRDARTDELLLAWGSGISRLEIERGRYILPLWLVDLYTALRERAPQLVDRAIWGVILATLALTLLIGQRVRRDAQIIGMPVYHTLLRWWSVWQGPIPPAAERHLPEWERTIRAQLIERGEVGPSDLAAVPRPLRGTILAHYEQAHRDRQALTLDGRRLRLDTHRWVARWHRHWYDLTGLAAQYRTFNAGVNRKADEAAAVFEEGIGGTRRSEATSEHGRGYLVDVELENRSLPRIYPLILLGNAPSVDVQAEVARALMNELYEHSSVVLVVPLPGTIGKPGNLRETFRLRDPHRDIVVLEPGDIVDILMASVPAVELERRILNRLDLSAFRPFVTRGPVPHQMFFGREKEIRTLVENAGRMSFAIIGNRQIGKTSLLYKVRRELTLKENISPLFFRYEEYDGIKAFLADVGEQAGIALATLAPREFSDAMCELKSRGPTPLLLIDEADALVKEDRLAGETLVRTFRALAEEQQCHFILCGSSSLPHALDDGASFYNNFLNPIKLGYFPQHTADEVLTRPLEYELRMELERRDELLALAFKLSSGHPKVVQLIGERLFNQAQHDNERVIRYANLEALRDSPEFTRTYIQTVWGWLSADLVSSDDDNEFKRKTAGERRDILLDRLITLVMPEEGATFDQIVARVADRLRPYDAQLDSGAVYRALRQLDTYSLLHQEGQIYRFTPGAFSTILHGREPVEWLTNRTAELLANLQPSSSEDSDEFRS